MGNYITKATPEDFSAMGLILQEGFFYENRQFISKEMAAHFTIDFWYDRITEWFSHGNLWGLILWENKDDIIYHESPRPVGCVIYGHSEDEYLSFWGQIKAIYIHPDFIAKGYGTRLLLEAMEDMKQIGYRYIYLWVLESNRIAREFYEHHGFLVTDEYCQVNMMDYCLLDVRYVKVL